MKLQHNIILLAATFVVAGTMHAWSAGTLYARSAADNGAGRSVNTAELIAVLQSNAPKTEKVKAFKPLAVFGGKDAVPAIAPYLSDPELSSWARIALEAIPDPACDEALRKAEAGLKGRLLIGVINSIGVRRDAQAVDALAARLADADAGVAVAAAAALGRIHGEAAANALEKALATAPPALRGEVADALVRCAETYLAEGKKNEAIHLYDVVSKANLPENRVREGLRGAIIARGSEGLPLLVELLKSADKKRFALGLKLTREPALMNTGSSQPGVTEALLAELDRAAPARKALLLMALADRADPKGRDALLQAAKNTTGDVRIASVRGLKKAGDASCGPVLLDAALDGNADVSAAAVDVLADLPGKEIDDLLVARLQADGAPGTPGRSSRLVLIELAGRRHIAAVAAVLQKLAADPDAKIRAAALTALGAIVPANDLGVLIARVVAEDKTGKPEEAKAAEAALRAAAARMPDRDQAATKVLDAIAQAPVAAKCTLLGVLVTIGGEKALKAVAAAAKDSRAEIRRAGYRALGEWTSADAGPEILALVKSGDPQLKIGALRAYIRIARQFDIPDAPRMAMFHEIMALAERDEERVLALDILKQIRTPESLSIAVGYLGQQRAESGERGAGSNDTKLSAAAARVVVTMSEKMVASQPAEVAAAMKQVLRAAKDKDVVDKARGLLNRTGKK